MNLLYSFYKKRIKNIFTKPASSRKYVLFLGRHRQTGFQKWKRNEKRKLWKFFHRNTFKTLFAVCAVFVLLFVVVKESLVIKAETVKFYPNVCLGGWQHPENAEGNPELSQDASAEEFSDKNSAVLGNIVSQIFCSDFAGEIPKDAEMKTLLLKLSWSPGLEVLPPSVVATTTVVVYPSDEVSSSIQNIIDAPASSTLTISSEDVLSANGTTTDEAPKIQNSAIIPETTPSVQNIETIPVSSEVIPSVPDSPPPTEVSAESAPVSFLNQLFQYASAQGTTTDAITTEAVNHETKSSSSEFLEVLYTLDGAKWQSLGKVSKGDWAHEFKIPVTEWDDISKLQVSIQSLPSIDAVGKVYLDGMWLEAEYENIRTQKKTQEKADWPLVKNSHRKTVRGERVFKASQNNFRADEEPSFEIYPSLQPGNTGEQSEEKTAPMDAATTTAWFRFGKFIETAMAQGVSAPPTLQVEKMKLLDGNGRETSIEPIMEEANGVRHIKVPQGERQFSPGKYILHAEFSDGDTVYITDQEFDWGVLAINVNKSVYLPGENVYIQLAVLNENGHTLCREPLELSITDPVRNVKTFSTDDGGMSFGSGCGVDNVTDAPDYFLHYVASSTGTYLLTLTNRKTNNKIESQFYVRANIPFDVERIGATRINPFKAPSYTMKLLVKANEDFSGPITESVPEGFQVTPSEEKWSASVETNGETKYIIWNAKNVKAGDAFTLSYTYQAPKISPEIHLLGPLQFTSGNFISQLLGNPKIDFKEERQWQIASDAINAKIRQEINILDDYLSAASGAYATSSEIIQIDTTQYTSPTYYFEVVASSSASVAFVVELESPAGATTSTIFVPTGSTSYTRFRSAAFTPTAGANNYIVRVGNASGATKGVIAARVIVLQNPATLSNTETQIEIGDNETYTSTATSTFASPKYWYYDSTKWDGVLTAYAEVSYQALVAVASSTAYNAAGTFTVVIPSGTASTTIELQGGGGAGGGTPTTANTGGAGGAGGQYAKSNIGGLFGSFTLVVAGTKAGTSGASGGAGNDSTWASTVVVAKGGGGGLVGTGSNVASTTGNTTGCVADVCFKGGDSGAGTATYGGGGGGGAGTTGNGGSATGAGVAGTGTVNGGSAGGAKRTTSGNGSAAATPGGGGGAGGLNLLTTARTGGTGAGGRATTTDYMATTTIALQVSDGTGNNFTGWTTIATIVGNGSAATSTRVRSSSFVPTSGRNYRIAFSNGRSGATFAIYNAKIIIDQTSPAKLEPQYLLANVPLASGTSLQNFLTKWDSAEWQAANTYIHELDSAASSASVAETDTSGGTQITGSVVSSPDNRKQSSALTMPANGDLDMKATTNNGDVYASRILVQVDMTQSLTFSISNNNIRFGTLSSGAARYASSTAAGDPNDTADAHTISVATNAVSGYAVSVNGTTLTSGANTIATSSTAAASVPGTEQFGLRLIVNSGTGSATAPYASADWAFDSATFPDQVASGSGDGITTIFGVRYIGNISANTEAGSYSSTLTYVATATF